MSEFVRGLVQNLSDMSPISEPKTPGQLKRAYCFNQAIQNNVQFIDILPSSSKHTNNTVTMMMNKMKR